VFSGIIEAIGQVLSIEDRGLLKVLHISRPPFPLIVGDSVAVNGCCLTVRELDGQKIILDLIPETLVKTNFHDLKAGSFVNMEPSLTLQKGIHGHLVQGHVDGIGTISKMERYPGDGWIMEVAASPSILDLMVEKGSIAVDGVSLTVIEVKDNFFSFSLIPHTAEKTTLGKKKVGDRVNLEGDLLAKYLKKWIPCM
jgi:riboflavin synthase